MTEPMTEYLSFVETKITELQQYTKLIRNNQINPPDINRALGEYTEVLWMLQAEYQRAKVAHYEKEAEFDDWWDGVFVATRDKLTEDLVKSKWPSKTEIETQARAENIGEYRVYKDALIASENRVEFIRRLLESWKAHDHILVNLSQNMRSEMNALSLNSRANATKRMTRSQPESVN